MTREIHFCRECGTSLLEEWRDIKGYEGFYQVSNQGRVKSIRRRRVIKGIEYIINKELVLKSYKHTHGYLKVNLSEDGWVKSFFVHRLVLQAFNPNEEELEVNHIDGNKRNNNLGNLEWVTQKENVKHAYELGLNTKRKKVLCVETGEVYKSATECAKENSVSVGLISGVCNGHYETARGKHYKYYEWEKRNGE